ncbi:hypothetical protein V1522DRAFT_425763, partial [Lipomyces starkeyi]
EGVNPEQQEYMMNLWLRSLQRASADFLTEEGTTYIINVERERREAGGEEWIEDRLHVKADRSWCGQAN